MTSTGEVIGTRTVVATIGNAPSPIVTKLNLRNQNGRVHVDRMMRSRAGPTSGHWAMPR